MTLWICESCGPVAVRPVAVPVGVVFAVVGVVLPLEPDSPLLPRAPAVAPVDVVLAAVGELVVALGAVAAAAGVVLVPDEVLVEPPQPATSATAPTSATMARICCMGSFHIIMTVGNASASGGPRRSS